MDALKYITPKFFTTIRNYSKGQFLKDLIAYTSTITVYFYQEY